MSLTFYESLASTHAGMYRLFTMGSEILLLLYQ